jgi:DNA recombination-dependent growth factor C
MFTVDEDLPKNFKEVVAQQMPRHAFREIDPKTNPEMSIGWVNAFDPLDTRLALEKFLYGKYLILGVRKDRKSIAGPLLKAQLNEAVKAQVRERKGRKLSRAEVAELKENVKQSLLARLTPATTLFEMVWNYETQEVLFSSLSAASGVELSDLFKETFGLTLLETNLATRAERFVNTSGSEVDLPSLEPAHFA